MISEEGCGYWLGKGVKAPSRARDILCILLWVVSLGTYTYVKTHQAVHVRWEHFTVCRENLNKKQKKKKELKTKKRQTELVLGNCTVWAWRMRDTDTPSCLLGPLAWNALLTSAASLGGSISAPNLESLALQSRPWLCYTLRLLTSVKEVIKPWVNICLQTFAGNNAAQCLCMGCETRLHCLDLNFCSITYSAYFGQDLQLCGSSVSSPQGYDIQ